MDGWIPYREVIEFRDRKDSEDGKGSEEASFEEQLLEALTSDIQLGRENRLIDIIKDFAICVDDSKEELCGDIINGVKKIYRNDLKDFLEKGKIGVFDLWKFGLLEIKEIFSSRTVDYIKDNVATRFMNNVQEKDLINRAEEYAARAVPNVLILQAWDLLCVDKLSGQQITDNKIHNSVVLTGEYVDEENHLIYKPQGRPIKELGGKMKDFQTKKKPQKLIKIKLRLKLGLIKQRQVRTRIRVMAIALVFPVSK